MEKMPLVDEDQIIVEDVVDSDCEEECKEQARLEFALKQRADEIVCKVLSRVVKEFLEPDIDN